MTTKHGFTYRNFRLLCDPMPMASGQFGAQVVIENEDGDSTMARRFPALDYFRTEQEAVEHARAWGERWVDDYFGDD